MDLNPPPVGDGSRRIPLGQPFPMAWYARHRMVPMGPRGVYQVQSQPYWWAQPFLWARDRLAIVTRTKGA
jgi:hypothetical protein